MANNRVFQAQALTTNTIAIGGLSLLRLAAKFQHVVASGQDGAFGIEDVDRAGMRIDAAMQCTDVVKANSILASTPGATTFYGKESGAATYKTYTIAAASGVIVWSGMNLALSKVADAVLGCNGRIRFTTGAKTLADVIGVTAGASAPSKTSPAPLYRPHTASFTPVGGEAITPVHTESINLSCSAEVKSAFGDTDIGETAVDLAPWGPLQVTLVHRDALAVSPSDIAAALVAAEAGVLTVQLLGRGGAADKTLTINNLQWLGSEEAHGPDYTDWTMTGVAGWTKRGTPDVNYDLTGANKLFAIA